MLLGSSKTHGKRIEEKRRESATDSREDGE